MTVREGKVVLAPTNPKDKYQHWIKDMRWSTIVKDQECYPAFALVNKAMGRPSSTRSGRQLHAVQLVPYNPDFLDESRIWMESRNVGNGFRCVRMVNSMYLNFDALHGVCDNTDVVLWKWCEGDNQRWTWKIQPYY